jgi:hypothetical protein
MALPAAYAYRIQPRDTESAPDVLMLRVENG